MVVSGKRTDKKIVEAEQRVQKQPENIVNQYLTKGPNEVQWTKGSLFIIWVQLDIHMKRNEFRHRPYALQESQFKMDHNSKQKNI